MTNSLSERRLAENEAYFRQHNEQVEAELNTLRKIAEEDGKLPTIDDHGDTLFYFYCECSDENCRQRIAITLNDYVSIHKNRRHFVVMPGHDVKSIERIIDKEVDYWVIEKTIPVPENVTRLKATPIDNT